MALHYPLAVLILLAGIVILTGCTGVPAPAPAPVPVAATATVPASLPATATAVPLTPQYTWTTETPYAGHPASKTYSFHGTGDYDGLTFTTENDATWVYTLTYPREGIFTVILRNAGGEEIQVLANEGGGGTSRKTAWLKAGDYSFDIRADTPWYITMTTA
jgi:hypothetical protein